MRQTPRVEDCAASWPQEIVSVNEATMSVRRMAAYAYLGTSTGYEAAASQRIVSAANTPRNLRLYILSPRRSPNYSGETCQVYRPILRVPRSLVHRLIMRHWL